ncbi:MAG: hypothetical protein IT318_10945 [Anaerolineales bacterium]|nr:hypothetical protein [Anaerolineales bacterium]
MSGNPLDNALPPEEPQAGDFKPWEQRPAPGMRVGAHSNPMAGPQAATDAELIAKLAQASERIDNYQLPPLIDQQVQLLHYPLLGRQSTPAGGLSLKGEDNAQVWAKFVAEELFDTRRVTLEHFHLFEWFPLAPGRYHTNYAQQMRAEAARELKLQVDGHTYYTPAGKASMVEGGVGAVRLRPRQVAGEPHYFMTASSSGVCHEGFPVLVPRRFYGPLKARMNAEGAAPVTLSGEMRYIDGETPAFFKSRRDFPGLYLHVDQVEALAAPRAGVTRYLISVAAAFLGAFQGQDGQYVTFCSFDPATAGEVERATQWMEQFYVASQYHGVVITDFDEVRPRFPGAVFALPDLLSGKLDQAKVQTFLAQHGFGQEAGKNFFLFYREINTQGGNYYEGPVTVQGDMQG